MTTTTQNPLARLLRGNWGYLLLLAVLILLPHLIGWLTGEGPFGMEIRGRMRPSAGASIFWQGIMVEVFVLAILALSYNLMFGFTGVISFGHALFFGMGGYAMGIVLEYSGWQSEIALAAGVIFGLVLSGVVGFVIALVSLRLRGVYFAIFTLAVAEMFAIFVARWQFTNAEDGFPVANAPAILNPVNNRLVFYYLALFFVVFTFLFIRRLMNSPTGRVLLAIRENEERAKAIGFDTLRHKLLAITLASMMAAGAGMVNVLFTIKVGPEIAGVSYTVDPLLMTIIGGIGTFNGPWIGAAGLHLSERILNREFDIGGIVLNIGQYWSLILGVAFIAVVLIFPSGIVGSISQWRMKRRLRRAQQAAPPTPPAAAPQPETAG